MPSTVPGVYSLAAPMPESTMHLDPQSGELTWQPTAEETGREITLIVKATEERQPPVSSQTSLLLRVRVRGETPPVELVANQAEADAIQPFAGINQPKDLLDSDEYTPDPDETPAGRASLAAVTTRAKEIYHEKNGVEAECRPIVARSDTLRGEMKQLQDGINGNQTSINGSNKRIMFIQNKLKVMDSPALQNEKSGLEASNRNLAGLIRRNNDALTARQPELHSLDNAMAPFNNRMQNLGSELDNCRKQWLDIRTPQENIGRANYEGLKVVVDDWLLIDGLCPQAFSWGALVADYDRAVDFIDKADKL